MKRHSWIAIGLAAAFLLPVMGTRTEGARVGPVSKSFTVNRGDMLEVYLDEGDIHVKAWEKNEATVQVSGLDEEEMRGVEITQNGNVIAVNYEEQNGHARRVRFEISVPAQFDMSLETSGGDIVLQGAFVGRLSGDTSGGDIRFGDVSGYVEMDTSGGDISGGNTTGDANLDTSGGDITVGNVGKALKASTAGGDITVGNVGGRADLSTAGGTIRVGDVAGEARASTAGGDIIMGVVSGSATMRTAGGDVELKGASGIVVAKTSGGDVMLRNVTGSVSGETSGGDVVAELIPGGKGASNLETAGGEIQLAVPENARATIEARIRIRERWKGNKDEFKIYSDFESKDYTYDDNSREVRATYNLNGGGERITLKAINGNIHIRKLNR